MVCKEDVITWFKEAASYRRIDVMCSLLNMCIPFELRYLGTCIEEQGKHDYQELRGAAITANNMDKLAKDFATYKGLLDKCARHRLTIYLSLLQSRNYSCANWIYNMLMRTESVDTYLANNNFYKDVNLHTELLLLFTLALNHPAFTFEQKRHFGDVVSRLAITEPDVPVQPTHNLPPCPPGLGYNIKPPLPVHPMPLGVPKGHNEAPIPPPGIPLPTVHASDFGPGMWSRTPYTNTTCPPADLTAFPPPISPLVSQQSSPTTSRSVSPSRMYSCRPHPPSIPPVAYLERLPPPIQPISDPLLAQQYNTDLKSVPIEEVHNEGLDKSVQSTTTGWMESMVLGNKLANGLISGVPMSMSMSMPPPPPPPKCQQMYLSNEMQQLSLDGDVSLRCTSSSASASSTSSECHSPPDTPTGPGRGPPLPDSQLSALPIVIPIQVPVQVPIQVPPISIATTTTTSASSSSSINKLRNGNNNNNSSSSCSSNSSNISGSSTIMSSSSSSSSSSNTNTITITNTNTNSNAPPPPGLPLPPPPLPPQVGVPLALPVSIQVQVPVACSTAPSINNDISTGNQAAAAAALYTSTCTVPYSSHYAVPPPPPPTTTFHNSAATTIPPPKVTCYNCGRCGHIGSECKEPTIEEITQKKGYQLDYTSPPPDAPPSAEK